MTPKPDPQPGRGIGVGGAFLAGSAADLPSPKLDTQVRPCRPTGNAGLELRRDDLYETPAIAVRALVATGGLAPGNHVWEPAAGRGAISRELTRAGFRVTASDLVAYEGADPGIEARVDFLLERKPPAGVSVLCTNPPFKDANAFIRHGLELGLPVIVLLRWQAAEGEGRSDIIDRHLRHVWLGIQRLPMMHREGWAGPRTKIGGAPFGWFCFEPDPRNGPPTFTRIDWRPADALGDGGRYEESRARPPSRDRTAWPRRPSRGQRQRRQAHQGPHRCARRSDGAGRHQPLAPRRRRRAAGVSRSAQALRRPTPGGAPMTPHRPGKLDGGFLVYGPNNRPIGCVIYGRGSTRNEFTAWGRSKLGDYATEAEAISEVRKAHAKRQQEEKRR